MIRVISGAPRSGKSLRTMQLILEYLEAGRRVFVIGIEGIDRTRVPIEYWTGKVEDWEQIPPGSVIVIDEAWNFLGKDNLPRQAPKWLQRFAIHAHKGLDYDIIIISQGTEDLHPFLKTKVSEHEHFLRKWGGEKARRFVWSGEMCTNPTNTGQRKRSEADTWYYPKALYGLYSSAGVHQVQKRTPKVFKVLGIALLAAVVLLVASKVILGRMGALGGDTAEAQRKVDAATHGHAEDTDAHKGGGLFDFGGTSESKKKRVLTTAEYEAQFVPRVPSQPWSAPAYDGAKITVHPKLLCVKVEPLDCHCYTEQITPYVGIKAQECMQIAKYGQYNPYQEEPKENPARDREEARPASRQTLPAATQVVGAGSGYAESPMRGDYVPPGFAGSSGGGATTAPPVTGGR